MATSVEYSPREKVAGTFSRAKRFKTIIQAAREGEI